METLKSWAPALDLNVGAVEPGGPEFIVSVDSRGAGQTGTGACSPVCGTASRLSEARFSLANAYEAAGDYDRAEPVYLQLWDETTGPLLVRVLGSLAIRRERTGDFSGAREVYSAAIDLLR